MKLFIGAASLAMAFSMSTAAEAISADAAEFISLRDQTLARRCEKARLAKELFRAMATHDRPRHDALVAEIKALDSDPTQRALAARSNELGSKIYTGEDLAAIRAMSERHQAACPAFSK